VWVDGKLVVDASQAHQARVDKGTIALQAGKKYSIKVDFAEKSGEAHFRLLWSSANQNQQVVPEEQLYTN
jgi:alpha-L-fucosidase